LAAIVGLDMVALVGPDMAHNEVGITFKVRFVAADESDTDVTTELWGDDSVRKVVENIVDVTTVASGEWASMELVALRLLVALRTAVAGNEDCCTWLLDVPTGLSEVEYPFTEPDKLVAASRRRVSVYIFRELDRTDRLAVFISNKVRDISYEGKFNGWSGVEDELRIVEGSVSSVEYGKTLALLFAEAEKVYETIGAMAGLGNPKLASIFEDRVASEGLEGIDLVVLPIVEGFTVSTTLPC